MKRSAKNRRLHVKLSKTLLLPVLSAVPFVPSVAWAQLQLGQIQGNITNEDNGRPLQGVTIVVTGPALQGEQSEITDKNGQYLITQLPPGDNYIIRFYFGDVVVERPNVRIAGMGCGAGDCRGYRTWGAAGGDAVASRSGRRISQKTRPPMAPDIASMSMMPAPK